MEKYYVYCHKNPTTNEIFYVGKGSGYRAYVTQSRGKFWYDYVKKHGIPIVEILHENLSEDESFILEKELIFIPIFILTILAGSNILLQSELFLLIKKFIS